MTWSRRYRERTNGGNRIRSGIKLKSEQWGQRVEEWVFPEPTFRVPKCLDSSGVPMREFPWVSDHWDENKLGPGHF